MDKHDAIYPGHPTTIALFIVNRFPSFAAATERGHEYAAALESNDIPGAGGNVAAALDFLAAMIKGTMPPTAAVAYADEAWRQSCYKAESLNPGQAQADALMPELMEKLKTWK